MNGRPVHLSKKLNMKTDFDYPWDVPGHLMRVSIKETVDRFVYSLFIDNVPFRHLPHNSEVPASGSKKSSKKKKSSTKSSSSSSSWDPFGGWNRYEKDFVIQEEGRRKRARSRSWRVLPIGLISVTTLHQRRHKGRRKRVQVICLRMCFHLPQPSLMLLLLQPLRMICFRPTQTPLLHPWVICPLFTLPRDLLPYKQLLLLLHLKQPIRYNMHL